MAAQSFVNRFALTVLRLGPKFVANAKETHMPRKETLVRRAMARAETAITEGMSLDQKADMRWRMR
jgi:hypothetical protein